MKPLLTVATRFARRTPSLIAVFLVLGFTLAFLLGAFESIRSTYLATAENTARADVAGYEYQVNVPEGIPEAVAAVQATGVFEGTWQLDATLTTQDGSRATSSTISLSTGQANFGVLAEGSFPSDDREIAVSRAAADALDVAVGDVVEVASEDLKLGQLSSLRVSGVLVSPSRPDEVSAALSVSGDVVARPPDRWLSHEDPYAQSELVPYFDSRELSYRSTLALVAEYRDVVSSDQFGALAYVPYLMWILTLCLQTSSLLALRRRLSAAFDGVEAAGASPLSSRAALILPLTVALGFGAVVGAALSWLLVALAKRPLGEAVGQYWTAVPFSAATGLGASVLLAVVSGTLACTAMAFSGRMRVGYRLAPRAVRSIALGTAIVGLALLAIPRTRAQFDNNVYGSLVGGALVVAAVALATVSLPILRRTPTLRRVATDGRGLVAVVAVSLALLIFFPTWFGGRSANLAADSEVYDNPFQPSGSLVIYGASSGDVKNLQRKYPALMADAYEIQLPLESDVTLRVVSPSFASCAVGDDSASQPGLNESQERCDSGPSNTPVNIIGLVDEGLASGELAPLADPQLLQDGSVGVLSITTPDGSITESSIIGDVSPDPELQGYLPGLVLGVGSTEAQELGLEPSGSEMVLIRDFARLSVQERAAVRATVFGSVGYAQVSEDLEAGDQKAYALSSFLGLATSIVTAIFVGAAGLSFVSSQRWLRELMNLVGSSRRERAKLSLPFVLPVGVSALAAGVVGWLSARDAGSRSTEYYGWSWPIPVLAALFTCAVITLVYSRAPRGADSPD